MREDRIFGVREAEALGLYPAGITVFCDPCEVLVTRDYWVPEDSTLAQRLEIARASLREEGWQCDETGDFCPRCREGEAPDA